MVGDRSLTITLHRIRRRNDARYFRLGRSAEVADHFTYFQSAILDDHSPLNAAGITTIDLIDFDFPPWHTAEDTMDKISAESLQIVGAVTLYYLFNFAFK